MNWIRRTEQSIERASALASIVLPTPGTSSMSRWPSASSTVSASRTTVGLPSITDSIASADPVRDLGEAVEPRTRPRGPRAAGGRAGCRRVGLHERLTVRADCHKPASAVRPRGRPRCPAGHAPARRDRSRPDPVRRPFAPAQPTVRRRDALRDVHVERETIVLHGDRVPRTRGRHFPPPPPRTPRPALLGPRAAPPDVRRGSGAARARTAARGRGRGGPHSAPPPLTWDFARHSAR